MEWEIGLNNVFGRRQTKYAGFSRCKNLKKDFKESGLLVVAHYSGLNVMELEDLRLKMRAVDVKFKVTKNRLTKLALPGTSFENISELFSGPTAIAYSNCLL